MNGLRLYRLLIIVGALVTLALLLLALLVPQRGIDQGLQTDTLMAVITYCTGAFAFWKHPHHLATRRLLALVQSQAGW